MKAIKKYLDNFWLPELLVVLSSAIFLIGNDNYYIGVYFKWIVLLFNILAGISILNLANKKKHWPLFYSILLIPLFGYLMLVDSMRDYYAHNLDLPENVELNNPHNGWNQEVYDSIVTKNPQNLSFELFCGSQPGEYSYHLWYESKDTGNIYLKAFEITHEDPLSVESLKNDSELPISPDTLILYEGSIIIFEGEWDYPYAARFEVWFEPLQGTEVKLVEKNFIIEGWMF